MAYSTEDKRPEQWIVRRCVLVQRNLARLRRNPGDADAGRCIAGIAGEEICSRQAAALRPPQADLIKECLLPLVQVLEEMASEELRARHEAEYRSVVSGAFDRFTGQEIVVMRNTYGPGSADLWNWPDWHNRPEWLRGLLGAASRATHGEPLADADLASMVESVALSDPSTIAGHLSGVLVGLIIGDQTANPWQTAATDWRSARISWLDHHAAPLDRVNHLLGQIAGEAPLRVERVCVGWRCISTSYW